MGKTRRKGKKKGWKEGVAGYLIECEVSHISHSGQYPQKHIQVGGGKVKMGWEEWEREKRD